MPRNQKTFQIHTDLDKEDVCTVVSIVPFLVSEFKPGIYPGRFLVQPCKDYKKPEILEIGQSVYFIPQFNGDEELPAHVVKVTSKEMAISLVNDYLSGQMDIGQDFGPGLTFVQGKITPEEFVLKHKTKHLDMQKRQLNWFSKLVQRADNDWNRYKNHMVISDNQRFAARALGLDKDWLVAGSNEVPVKCPACLQNCAPEAIVCANCRCILKPEEYKKLSFAA